MWIILVPITTNVKRSNPTQARCTRYNIIVYQLLVTDRWVSPCTPVSSTNKTDYLDITEILLNVVLNAITQTLNPH
jgi:hypothetical protein